MTVQITYHNLSRQTFLQGAFVQASGLLLVDYDSEGKARLTLAADQLGLQRGDPSTSEYVKRLIPMMNPHLTFFGIVTGIPVNKPNCRVYTLTLRVPHRDGSTDSPWDGTYLVYDLHCTVPLTVRWAHRPLPQINDSCFVTGELIGLLRVGDRQSPLVRVAEINVTHSTHLEENIATDHGDYAEEGPGTSG